MTRGLVGLGTAILLAVPAPGLAREFFFYKAIYEIRIDYLERIFLEKITSSEERLVAVAADGHRYRIRKGPRGLTAARLGAGAPPPARPAGILPDGTIAEGGRGIRRAWLARPTRRYRHGVLGDSIEAGAIRAETALGRALEYILPPDSVFEDRHVRLADVTGDGQDEAVVVRSYLDFGAALAVFSIAGGRLRPMAESAPLGIPHRWLNPVGSADFDGDGKIEIAAVTTPHIGGVLRLYRVSGGRLVEVYRVAGFSNHAMGSRELGLAALLDADGDGLMDMALPADGRRRLRIAGFPRGRTVVREGPRHGAPIVTAILAVDLDRDGRRDLIYGLGDGTLVAACR